MGDPRPTHPSIPGVEMDHRRVVIDGVGFHVAVAGSGPPVVLLHGFPQSWFLWRRHIAPLAEDHTVYAPDLRGSGESDAPDGWYDKRDMAREMLRLLDELDVNEPVVLAGHDWGGWIGFIMCMLEPERFDRFLALNIPPPWSDPKPANAKLLLKSLPRLWYQFPLMSPWLGPQVTGGALADRFWRGIERSAHADEAFADGSIDVYRESYADPAHAHAGMMIYRTFLLKELAPVAAGRYLKGRRLTVPTHMLFGRNDFAISESLITADHSRHADDITYELIDDCGHFIVDERPELVLERIRTAPALQ